jgi:hypothetical protein
MKDRKDYFKKYREDNRTLKDKHRNLWRKIGFLL